jgi:hypothetical protein
MTTPLMPETRRALESIATRCGKPTRLSPTKLLALRVAGWIYTVENETRTFAHLTAEGREVLDLGNATSGPGLAGLNRSR